MKNGFVILDLQRAAHATLHQLMGGLADLGLTGSEINALGNLAGGNELTVSGLGAAAGTRPATLTGVLDRLERRGLIARGARPGDRRTVLVKLTADGERATARVCQALLDLERHALADLSAEAVAGARTALRALAVGAS